METSDVNIYKADFTCNCSDFIFKRKQKNTNLQGLTIYFLSAFDTSFHH